MGGERREPKAFRAASLMARDENNEEMTLYILKEARLNDCSYILVTGSEKADKNSACYLLEDMPDANGAGVVHESMKDEKEAGYMLEIFQTILGDKGVDIDLLDG